jgi:hypothetical protein
MLHMASDLDGLSGTTYVAEIIKEIGREGAE